jgi:actin-related protein 3
VTRNITFSKAKKKFNFSPWFFKIIFILINFFLHTQSKNIMKGILSYFPPVVIDNGSGFTRAGFAGNAFPSAVFESATVRDGQRSKVSPVLDFTSVSCVDTDFPRKLNSSTFPIKHGIVEDWNAMENIWHSCFFDELRCNPQDHYVLLTESPLNTPENREEAAEIMFETFNVPGMQISIQAILSLIASSCVTNNNNNKWIASSDLTGCVIDSGSGVTQIIPVVNGHVMSSCIEQIEMGGRDVTAYVQQLLRERKEPIPSDVSIEAARIVKERYAYTCPDIEKECRRFDSNPEKITTTFTSCHQRSGLPWSMNIQYERFLAPEIVINPKVCQTFQNCK